MQPESFFIVTLDRHQVRCQDPSGKPASVAWDELEAVVIETNDSGPIGMDVWWLLIKADGTVGCALPQGATGDRALLDKLRELPGFDHNSAIDAMSCADNRTFFCWRRSKTSD